MLDTARLGLFLTATLIFLVTPGPAVTYIVTRSVAEGRRSGLLSTLGIACGDLVHVAGSVLGLSALFASSALAFNVVKYAGAAYLVWLGVRTFLGAAIDEPDVPTDSATLRRAFWQGVLVNIFNPKTALFFLAFLPQFVDPSRGSSALQMALLGSLFVGLSLSTGATWALLAGSASVWLSRRGALVRSRQYVAGSVYVGLGIATALAGPNKK